MYYILWIFGQFTPRFYENIFSLLFIQNIGLTFDYSDLGSAWFLSALFWGVCFYFYLYKLLNKQWFNYMVSLLIVFSYAISVHADCKIYENIYYIFNRGMVRSIGGIGLGYFIYIFYETYNNKNISLNTCNVLQKLGFTVMEIYTLSFLCWNSFLHEINYDNAFIFIIHFVIIILLFVVKKGYLSQVLNNSFSVFLGKFTFSIYLTHEFILELWHLYIQEHHLNWVIAHPIQNLFAILFSALLFGMLVYYLFEKPVTKYLKKYL